MAPALSGSAAAAGNSQFLWRHRRCCARRGAGQRTLGERPAFAYHETAMRGLLIDLDGVLYQGDDAIPGATEAIAWLGERGIPHLFVTNTTSRPRQAIVDKLAALGMRTDASRVLTPPVAAREWLARHAPGPVALFVPEATRADFAGVAELDEAAEAGAAAVVLGDLGEAWTFARLNRAFRLLMAQPAPALVALGLTRYWKTPSGLQLDVGPFARALEYAAGCEAAVLGKPSAQFFEIALAMLGCAAPAAAMIGDDIVGDVQGAQQAGLRGVLVRTGKFRPQDLEGRIRPDAVLDSIAGLPAWWRAGCPR